MKTFVVELWSNIFLMLKWLSFFEIVRKAFPRISSSYGFVDSWVIGNVILSLISFTLLSNPILQGWGLVVLPYAAIRVWEIVIYQINVLLFDEYRTKKAGNVYYVRSFRRIVLHLIHNYIEILFWFAFIYRNYSSSFISNIPVDSINGSFIFSLLTMSSLRHAGYKSIDNFGEYIIVIQSNIGILMVVLVFARFLTILPSPKTIDDFEK